MSDALAAVAGARVLARLDLNVPLNGGMVADDARLRAALPTLRMLMRRRNRVLVVAHLGRPRGVDPRASLAPVAAALSRLLGADVPLVGTPGERAPGRVALLENVRFDPREASAAPADRRALAAELRAGADVVVSDAFPTFHRRHATIAELVESGPSVPGLLVAAELEALAPLRDPPAPGLLVLAGGTRAREKVALLARLAAAPHVTVALGAQLAAGLAELARDGDGHAAAQAHSVLASPRTVVPSDLVIEHDAGPPPRTIAFDALRPGMRVVDLGPRARTRQAELVHAARVVVWNGPPGFQHEPAGRAGADALAAACATSPALTIVGGGTTAMPLRRLRLAERVTHVSTGGTVLLHLLAGLPMPGLEALRCAAPPPSARTATTSSSDPAVRPLPAPARSARP